MFSCSTTGKRVIYTKLCNTLSTLNLMKSYYITNTNVVSECNEALSICEDDVSSLTPYISKSFNIAPYVNTSENLKKLLQLNVNLSKIEKKPHLIEKLLKLDFEKDIKDHIYFLNNLVTFDNLGAFITKNPMIFYETLDDLNVRVNYLLSKNFNTSQIQHIVLKNPFWLMFR